MKKNFIFIPFLALLLFSCSNELETCEYNLEQTQIELESIVQKYNQLVSEYNDLYSSYETLENQKSIIVRDSKSNINDIIRNLDWKSYDGIDDLKSDLYQIAVMRY